MRLPLIRFCFVAVLLVLMSACSVTPPPPRPVAMPATSWNSLPAAQALSQQGNKPLLVLLYSPGCPYCQQMKSHTLADPGVQAFIDRNFAKVQVTSLEAPDLFRAWSVDTVPTTVIVAPNGQRLETLKGYMPAAPYLEALHAVLGR